MDKTMTWPRLIGLAKYNIWQVSNNKYTIVVMNKGNFYWNPFKIIANKGTLNP